MATSSAMRLLGSTAFCGPIPVALSGLQEEGQLSLLLAMMDWSGFRAARHVPAIPRNDSVDLFPDWANQWDTKRKLFSLVEVCALPSAVLLGNGTHHELDSSEVTKLEYRGILRKRQVMVTMEEHLQCSCQCAFRLACPKHHAFDHRNCLCVRRHRWRKKCRNEECRARRKKCREEGCRKGARQGRKRGKKKDRGKRKNSQEDSSTVLPTTQLQTSQTTA